ncbi:hypothetical protein [Reichenbachiella versicolor]|uniref:hypothetical protein n=1 Tax=Reichenbachiella versicolor TaxID=1821036 RepID=UPI000D6DE828|nr:hypothetical protein [Reichenbachiella versicolor]
MEIDSLKTQFNASEASSISRESLLKMLDVNQHPALKGIRIQMVIESAAWAIFLAVYYNFFDGHSKPLIWNIVLVMTYLLMIVHNTLSHRIVSNPINGDSIIQSLKNYLARIKRYARISISSRVIGLFTLFGFFLSGVEKFQQIHYTSMVVVIVMASAQGYVLWIIWKKRIHSISGKYREALEG